jgi:formate hydrogenlyase subunit 3/multisubunit Na+/H+ antiporter MnhD subunit
VRLVKISLFSIKLFISAFLLIAVFRLDVTLVAYFISFFFLFVKLQLFYRFCGFAYYDHLSVVFSDLSIIVLLICYFSGFKDSVRLDSNINSAAVSILVVLAVVARFVVKSTIVFFVLFEISFVAMFLHVIMLRKASSREIASFYMLIFAVFFSLPFLIYLVSSMKINVIETFFVFHKPRGF